MARAFLLGGLLALLVASEAACIRVAALPSAADSEDRETAAEINGGAVLSAACEDAKVPRERASACATLAGYFEAGAFGLPQDPNRAALLWESAIDTLQASCEGGDVEDCTHAAAMIGKRLRSAGESDPERGDSAGWMVRYAEDGCRGGDVSGCALLGQIYDRGREVPRDLARSTAYYEEACGGGHSRSCLLLASRAEGKATLRAYERACDAGSGFGCAAAAQRYRKGASVKPSVGEAGVLFARGCALGDPASCVLGAEMYASCAAPDKRRAARFASAGCQQGGAEACLLLGAAFERGEGVRQDRDAALDLYERTCELGLRKGCDALRAARSARGSRDAGVNVDRD